MFLFRASVLCLFIWSAVAQDTASPHDPPNVVFVLLDDVGWRDLGRNVADSPIPTPFIDDLTARGVHLAQHYVHSVCSPSRAAFMTGRYHVNTGMTNVLIPGTPAGLPSDIPTLPALMSELGGYSTAMTGKWHLGHAQHKMTPIGRGFDYFTGMYMWDVDSYTKQMWELPWEAPLVVDWVTEQRYYNSTEGIQAKDTDGRPYSYTYHHFADARHATEAITGSAEEYIHQHVQRKQEGEESPLFLYVAYTAAHSPLQPLPRHLAHCMHIPHSRRRDFCGLMVGLDEALRNLTATVESQLGSNTIMVVASDNGGSAYFGGMNAPLRGHKGTPFEAGVRVPAFVVDFTPDQRYLSQPAETARAPTKPVTAEHSRVYRGLMHISDWLPTLLSFAGVPAAELPAGIDGKDFSAALRSAVYEDADSAEDVCQGDDRNANAVSPSPRAGVLLEMYSDEESVFHESLSAYRLGDYKLIRGTVRDDNYYYESANNRVNSSRVTMGSAVIERAVDLCDATLGKGPCDTLSLIMVHMWMPKFIAFFERLFPEGAPAVGAVNATNHGQHEATNLRLYNIARDPCERINLAGDPQYASIIAAIDKETAKIAAHRRHVLPLDVQLDISLGGEWAKYHVAGDCSANPAIAPEHCRFTHSWVHDDADPMELHGLMKTTQYMKFRSSKAVRALGAKLGSGLLVLGVIAWVTKTLYGWNDKGDVAPPLTPRRPRLRPVDSWAPVAWIWS